MRLRTKEYLPLLHILKKLPPAERQIILSHLSDESCVYVEQCVAKVLKGKKRIPLNLQEQIRQCMKANEASFSKLFATRWPAIKRKTLAKVGGGPFTLLLSIGIPLLMSLLSKK